LLKALDATKNRDKERLNIFPSNYFCVKFKLVNIGPIRDAEIELDDFMIFLGSPLTGKSFVLRNIYSSLILLDDAYLGTLREKIFNTSASVVL